MKKTILFLSAAATLLATAACQNFKKGEGGLEYKIVKDAGAEKAKPGDFLIAHIEVRSDRKDSLLNSTYDFGIPQPINVIADSLPGTYPGDHNTILRMLGEGDSAVFRINLDTMAAKTGQPKPEVADKYISFKIKVEKHLKKGNLTDSAMYAQINELMEKEVEKLKNAEEGKLAKYVSDKKLDPKKTESGLQYVIKDQGKGEKPVVGDTVVVNYVGNLVSGKVFDTNNAEVAKKENTFNPMRPYEPIRFRLGHDPVIKGWTEGIQLLNKGGKITLLVPSNLGYGEQGGGGAIPPYAPLVFDVELVDIVPGPKDEEQKPAEPIVTPVK